MPDDSSALDDIRLYIVDTAKFESATFIRDMDLIRAFSAGNQYLRRLESLRTAGTHYYGEYLSQGALKIQDKCKSVSAQAMLESGLASLRPEFGAWGQGQNEWANKVVRIRQQLSSKKEQQQNISAEQAEAALAVSQTFGPVWRLPVAINLLPLLPDFNFREYDSSSIVPYEEMPEVSRAQ
ncbi:hypothetical protein HII31_00383 [Pseudocercospora fuligena]|uniref:Uncharacterized protein n=1 Tax=Pseudocercospora fuligena TaxID=685502 RepID=A0A8H6VS70_9PEZI|nr:hypothetical protein HII31_00383 [Pseudocercospora fuligena]